jgi:hypothetical protein
MCAEKGHTHGGGAEDTIEILILEDGTIRMTSSKISGANHGSADAFVRNVEKLAGGSTEVHRRKDANHHHAEPEHKVRRG